MNTSKLVTIDFLASVSSLRYLLDKLLHPLTNDTYSFLLYPLAACSPLCACLCFSVLGCFVITPSPLQDCSITLTRRCCGVPPPYHAHIELVVFIFISAGFFFSCLLFRCCRALFIIIFIYVPFREHHRDR